MFRNGCCMVVNIRSCAIVGSYCYFHESQIAPTMMGKEYCVKNKILCSFFSFFLLLSFLSFFFLFSLFTFSMGGSKLRNRGEEPESLQTKTTASVVISPKKSFDPLRHVLLVVFAL